MLNNKKKKKLLKLSRLIIIKNLPKKPVNGGIPAKDKIENIKLISIKFRLLKFFISFKNLKLLKLKKKNNEKTNKSKNK